jgi:hypothetical protein
MEMAIRNKELEITSPTHRKGRFRKRRAGDKSEVRILHQEFLEALLLTPTVQPFTLLGSRDLGSPL